MQTRLRHFKEGKAKRVATKWSISDEGFLLKKMRITMWVNDHGAGREYCLTMAACFSV
jgi:hypothetical protein